METKKIKAFLAEYKPEFNRGDNHTIMGEGDIKKVIIRNIYSRRLEDLTFNDLNMLGYTNPNFFVKEWIENNKSFNKDKIVWVVVYSEDTK